MCIYFTEFSVSSLYGWQDPREQPGVELEVVEWPEHGQGVEQGAAHHHDQVVDRHHLELRESESSLSYSWIQLC